MQKRDNVSFGGIIYGKLRKKFAKEDSAGVIETAYEVMNSEEYKASEEELRRIVMRQRGEGADAVNEINNPSDNINSGIDSSTSNIDNASDKEEAISIDDSNILGKGDDEFNAGDENTSAQNNIDTDNALSENDAVNADGIDEVGDVGNEADVQGNAGAVNEEGQKNTANDKLKLAISYVLGYKEFEEKITKFFKPIQLRTEPNTAFYWSGTSNGIGGKDFALDFANRNGGITLEGLMKKQGIEMPIWDINDPISINAWEYASAVYASQASGVVCAIIGKSTRKNSVWNKIEFEIMTNKTSDVTEIIIIEPETLEKTIIFRR